MSATTIRLYRPADHAEWLRMRRALFPDLEREDEVADAAAWLARPDADGCRTSPVAYLEAWYVDEEVERAVRYRKAL